MKQTLYIVLSPYCDKPALNSCSMQYSEGYKVLGTIDVEFDVPDFDLNAVRIGSLREGRVKTVVEFETKLENIDRSIEELLALPHLQSASNA